MRLVVTDLKDKTGGPGAFFASVVPVLRAAGVQLTGILAAHADAALVSPFCRPTALAWIRLRGWPIVQRLDGLHYREPRHFNDWMRRAYDVASAVVFQSEFSRRICVAHFGTAQGREHVILNGTDLSTFHPGDASAPPKPGLRLIASAFWRPQKRLRDCLEIFGAVRQRFPGATLRVLGDVSRVPGEVRGLPGVTYTGHQPRHEVARELREADIFLHPSWFDPCPNAVVEALASGLPVVHTRNGGTRELVPPGCGVELRREPEFDLRERDVYDYARIPRVDVGEAVAAIAEVATDLSRFRQRVRERRAEFGIERTARAYLGVLDGCVRRRFPMAADRGGPVARAVADREGPR